MRDSSVGTANDSIGEALVVKVNGGAYSGRLAVARVTADGCRVFVGSGCFHVRYLSSEAEVICTVSYMRELLACFANNDQANPVAARELPFQKPVIGNSG